MKSAKLRTRSDRALFQKTPFSIETLRAGVQRRIERGFVIIGAELSDVERFIIVCGKDRSTFLNRLAQSIGDFVRHVGMDDHRPAAEIEGRDRAVKPLEMDL